MPENLLYYGDNLDILRERIAHDWLPHKEVSIADPKPGRTSESSHA